MRRLVLAALTSSALFVSTAARAEEAEPSPLLPADHEAQMAKAPVDEQIVFKPTEGLQITSRDKRFSMQTRLRTQLLYALEVPHEEGEDASQNLSVRRMRLLFSGHAYSEDVKYYIQFGFSTRDMLAEGDSRRTPIRDVRMDLTHLRDLSFRIGETKVPFSRERMTSSGDLQFVDRSPANEEFSLDRDAGIQIMSKDLGGLGLVNYQAGVFIGEGRGNFELGDLKNLYSGRLELTPLGSFESDFVDFERSLSPKLAIGVGYGRLLGAKRTRGLLGPRPEDEGTTDSHNLTVDLHAKVAGFSLYTAYHRRSGTRDGGGAVDEMGMPIPVEAARNGWGLLAQAGYLLPNLPYEVSLRYTGIRGTGETSLNDLDEAGVGLNWYVAEHALKLQLDVFRNWSGAFADGTDRVRVQTQISF